MDPNPHSQQLPYSHSVPPRGPLPETFHGYGGQASAQAHGRALAPGRAPYASRHQSPPGPVVVAMVMMGVGAFCGLGFTLIYGVTAAVSVLDEESARAQVEQVAGVATPETLFVYTVVFALMGLAYTIASITMAVRARRPAPATPRAVVAVQVLAFLSLPLSGWTFFVGNPSTVIATGVMGLYCAVTALLVLVPSARNHYWSRASSPVS